MEMRLVITCSHEDSPNGRPSPVQVRVDGPLHDKILCYGLLKAAEHVIHEYGKTEFAAQGPGRIVIPEVKVLGGNNRGK